MSDQVIIKYKLNKKNRMKAKITIQEV